MSLKVLVLDRCADNDFMWLFPGTKEELIIEWKEGGAPDLVLSKSAGCFRGIIEEITNVDSFEAAIMDNNATLHINEHDETGDHYSILTIDGHNHELSAEEINALEYDEIVDKFKGGAK